MIYHSARLLVGIYSVPSMCFLETVVSVRLIAPVEDVYARSTSAQDNALFVMKSGLLNNYGRYMLGIDMDAYIIPV